MNRTYVCELIGHNKMLSRDQWKIVVSVDGVEVGYVEGETECGHFTVSNEEGDITQEMIDEINKGRVWNK